jgi:signal transduction histidine kinase
MQRRVRLQAIVGTVGRQLTDRYFLVPSFDHFVPIDQTRQRETVPLRKIATLLLSDTSQEDLVRISGVVTQQNAGGLYIRDDTGSTFAQSVSGSHPPGSVVTVEGYAAVAPFRPIMRAVRIEKLGVIESSPPPLQLEAFDIDVSRHNERVAIDCEFVDQADGEEETVLRCRAGDHPFEARLPTWDFPVRPLKKGDQLRLTGIYEVTTSRPNPHLRWADGFRLQLSGPDAIMVLRPAPWWTLQRAFVVLGLLVTVLIGIFLWNWLLRRKVAVQAETIAAQVEQAAIKDERQRVARELHDTLEQELTGLAIQLGNIASVLGRDNTPALQGLSLARQMLQHSRDEARSSISDLRNSHLLERSLPEAMRQSFAAATEDATAEFRFEVEGDPQPLHATTANHLLRIACEAVRNAVRHANAKRIATRLTYGCQGVDLEIDDDGVGFQADQKPPAGHFGLAGMRERAYKIHAEYSVQSSEGLGSKVRVQLPWSSPVAQPESPS